MTPSNPCQPMPWQYSQTPSTPSIRKGLGLGGSARLKHWQGSDTFSPPITTFKEL